MIFSSSIIVDNETLELSSENQVKEHLKNSFLGYLIDELNPEVKKEQFIDGPYVNNTRYTTSIFACSREDLYTFIKNIRGCADLNKHLLEQHISDFIGVNNDSEKTSTKPNLKLKG